MLQSTDARTGQSLATSLPACGTSEVNAAVNAAQAAFDAWQDSDGNQRAALLNALAAAIEADRETLVSLADQETAS